MQTASDIQKTKQALAEREAKRSSIAQFIQTHTPAEVAETNRRTTHELLAHLANAYQCVESLMVSTNAKTNIGSSLQSIMCALSNAQAKLDDAAK